MEPLLSRAPALTLSCILPRHSIGLQNSPRVAVHLAQRSHNTQSTSSSHHQTVPLTGFYALLLEQPLHSVESVKSTAPESPKDKLSKSQKNIAKARVVFGSRLAGPAERREELDRKSTVIAGIKVP